MQEHQYKFIKYLLHKQVIQFGRFRLKSGRISPYFFNTSLFNTGYDLIFLGQTYASALINSKIDIDILFGSAYKGIPIVTATSIIMAEKYQYNIPFCFNRKELKRYGDSGNIVGGSLKGKVILIDDVITSGSTVHNLIKTITTYKATTLSGILISFDRQEKVDNTFSAIQEIEQNYKCPVISIINLVMLMTYMEQNQIFNDQLPFLYSYKQQYCI